eukprot:7380028-Prymnesium_polylepis.1
MVSWSPISLSSTGVNWEGQVVRYVFPLSPTHATAVSSPRSLPASRPPVAKARTHVGSPGCVLTRPRSNLPSPRRPRSAHPGLHSTGSWHLPPPTFRKCPTSAPATPSRACRLSSNQAPTPPPPQQAPLVLRVLQQTTSVLQLPRNGRRVTHLV